MFKLFKRQKKDPQEIIKELFADAELPSFPSAIMEVLATLRNPDSTPQELIQKVECDPGLSVKVLRTVNSAAFGLSSKIEHIGHAVSLLGRARLESVVLSIAVNKSFSGMKWEGFNYKQYWYTAAKRACLASQIALNLHPTTEMESFTEGLLLDMGVLLMFMQKKKEYVDIYSKWQQLDVSLSELEYEAFGFDHSEVGASVADIWNLPSSLIAALANHHNPEEAESLKPSTRLVSLMKDHGEDDCTERIIEAGVNQFHLDEAKLTSLVESSYDQALIFSEMLNNG